MSHFTVLVAASSRENMDAKLLPFHEYECTGSEEYTQEVVVHEKDNFRVDALEIITKACQVPDEVMDKIKVIEINHEGVKEIDHGDNEYLMMFLDGKYTEIFEDWDGGYLSENGDWVRKTNPNAKWDWYQVGGRWTGLLRLKPDSDSLLDERIGSGRPGVMTEPNLDPMRADFAPKSAIDFDAINQAAADRVNLMWDDVELVLETAGQTITAEEFHAMPSEERKALYETIRKGFFEGKKKEDIGEELDEAWFTFTFFDPDYPTRQECLEGCVDAPITYAFIDENGNWVGKGDVGFWGIDSNREPDSYADAYREFIRRIPDDQMLFVVDCHI